MNKTEKGFEFVCPRDGVIPRDEVAFLCNQCREEEVIFRRGIYICPNCLKEGENFQCMICDSKDVKVVSGKKEKRHL